MNKIIFSLLLFALAYPISATVVQTLGTGSAVTTVEATADFENSAALNGQPYTENGLSFSRTNLTFNNNGCGFAGCSGHSGFFPGFSGNYIYGTGNGFFTISTTEGQLFRGLEFISGTGNSPSSGRFIRWEALRSGNVVGSGTLSLTTVSVIGFSDAQGFDTLKYTRSTSSAVSFTGTSNAPALDQVRAQFSGTQAIPEPSSLVLGIICLAISCLIRRK